MSYLTTDEALSVTQDVAAMFASTEETAAFYRKKTSSSGSFAGDKAAGFHVPGNTLKVVAQDKQPSDLLQVDHDYVLLIEPYAIVTDEDEVDFRGSRFMVVDIQEFNLFGTVTHQAVAVKKMRGV